MWLRSPTVPGNVLLQLDTGTTMGVSGKVTGGEEVENEGDDVPAITLSISVCRSVCSVSIFICDSPPSCGIGM